MLATEQQTVIVTCCDMVVSQGSEKVGGEMVSGPGSLAKGDSTNNAEPVVQTQNTKLICPINPVHKVPQKG